MKVHKLDGHVPIKMWTDGVPVEDSALKQLENVATLSFIHKHVAVMPDVHWGMGATVGSVLATKGAIIPAAVGVDIGCGMIAGMTSLTASDLPDNLHKIRDAIEVAVPHGRTDNGGLNDKGGWTEESYPSWPIGLRFQLDTLASQHPQLERAAKKAHRHLGTLGTGNHFIELCLDEDNHVWIMLHSGSRGIGNAIGQYFITKARERMEEYFISLPDKDLAYLPESTQEFRDYIKAVEWAQAFAEHNRNIMFELVTRALEDTIEQPVKFPEVIVNCHHNYVAREHHFGANVLVTRKGAVRARLGDLGIIPGSMGARSYIVRGLGNDQSFHTCSHGAGRIMSRTEARKRFTVEDHIKATEGVECRKDADVIDETPGAYKNIDAVMEAQKDLVEVVHTLKQILCVKG